MLGLGGVLVILLRVTVGWTEDLLQGPAYPCPPESYKDPELYGPDGLPTFRPLIIGHRGASGMFPENTGLAYRKAAEQGADVIECDIAITKDHQLICAHDPFLNLTTDVADRTEFADKLATYNMDDDDPNFNWNDVGNISNWFSFDFTLEELKSLKKRQANNFRDPGYDWTETFVTLEEFVQIAKDYGETQGRVIGIYPELKYPHAVNKVLASRNVPKRYEDYVLEELGRLGVNFTDSPVFLQSFEMSSLEYVQKKTELYKLVFLVDKNLTDSHWARLDKIRLSGIGVGKAELVTPGYKDKVGRGSYKWGEPTDFLNVVHDHKLKAHVWTFRNEWMNLYWEDGQDPYSQMEEFLALGTDGFFTDFPLTARRFFHYKGVLCGRQSNSSNYDVQRPHKHENVLLRRYKNIL